MLFSKINLLTELIRERETQQALLNEVHRILQESSERDEDVLRRLRMKDADLNFSLHLSEKEKERIYNLESIRNICVRFRLRFLSTAYFKSEYPYAAVAEIKAFEKKHSVSLTEFYIAAPDHTFNLENVNKDPLLFARLDDGTYYLIHQWGKDLAWHKRFTLWPLQSFRNCFIFLWIVATAFSFLIPSTILQVPSFEGEIYLRSWLSIYIFITLLASVIWVGFTFDKTVSDKNWNSKFYNA
jgi:hypothetical protein